MEKDPRPLDLAALIKKLRLVTSAVQLMPFVYTVLFIISLVVSFFASEDVVRIFDTLFYTSPIVVIAFLILSKLLRLCRWHRMACLLPLFPRVVSFVDYHIIELTEVLAQVNIILFATMAFLLLIAAYNIFIK